VKTRTRGILAIFQLQTFCTRKQPKHQLVGDDKDSRAQKTNEKLRLIKV
jgi:hypothetical protein